MNTSGKVVQLFVISLIPVIQGCSSMPSTDRYRARAALYDVTQPVGTRSPLGRAIAGDSGACTNPTAEQRQELGVKYEKTLSGCGVLLRGYEDQATRAKWSLATIAIIGGVAGSIVVPTLAAKAVVAKSTLAGWGGLAGATNFAQHVLANQGLAADDPIKVREGIRTNLTTAIGKFANPQNDFCTKEVALAEMAAACINYELFAPGQTVTDYAAPKAGGDPKPAEGDGKKPAEGKPAGKPAEGEPMKPEGEGQKKQ